MNDTFNAFARRVSTAAGTPTAFAMSFLLVIGWGVSGPFFDFSEVWQMWINTGTTIITFLMVFLIQATQNRDSKALHLKLDELILASQATNKAIALEDQKEANLEELKRDIKLSQAHADVRQSAQDVRNVIYDENMVEGEKKGS